MRKQFKLSKEQVVDLVLGYGSCFASDRITVDRSSVGFMYREVPDNEFDSGWRFLAGDEDDEYMSNSDNHAIYSVNTIANYDHSIIALLDSETGAVFEKIDKSGQFVRVPDWHMPDE